MPIILRKKPQLLFYATTSTFPKVNFRYDTTNVNITGWSFVLKIEGPDDVTGPDILGSIVSALTGEFEFPVTEWAPGTFKEGLNWAQVYVTRDTGEVEVYPDYYIEVVRGL